MRLEALARGSFSEEEQAEITERIHRSAPQLGIGAFLAENEREALELVRREEPPRLASVQPGTHVDLDNVVMKALATEPSEASMMTASSVISTTGAMPSLGTLPSVRLSSRPSNAP